MAKSVPKVRPNNLVFLNRDRGYRFTDTDPQLVELRTLIDKSGMTVQQIQTEVSNATGGAYTVSQATVYNWLNGKTKRPQNITMNWVAYAIGFERHWVKRK